MGKYILFKRYEIRMGSGKWPEITRMYMTNPPPLMELTKSIDEAYRADTNEVKQLAYITNMDYERII